MKKEVFSEIFLDTLPDEPISGADSLCDEFFEFDKYAKDLTTKNNGKLFPAFVSGVKFEVAGVEFHDQYIDALGAFLAFSEAKNLEFGHPNLQSEKLYNIALIYNFFKASKQKLIGQVSNLKLTKAKERFSTQIGSTFAYEFSQGDLDKVQELLNSLREEIKNTDKLEESHRERLLKRLEQLQAELHKRISDLDKFWGLIGDAGVVFGKLGEDAKPIVDRIREITGVVWRTQSRAEELPTDSQPALINPSSDGITKNTAE